MPYIPSATDASKDDRAIVDPHIQNLRHFIVEDAKRHPKRFFRAMRLVRDAADTVAAGAANSAAIRVHKQSKMRYWLIDNLDGLYNNIAKEAARRLRPGEPSSLFRDAIFPGWWREMRDQEPANWPAELLTGLHVAINKVAEKYDYDCAYVGTCNYSFSELSIHVFFDVLGDSYDGAQLQFLVWMWKRMADEFYDTVAGPYEDDAIKKNGDCSSFIRALDIIKKKNGTA